MGTKAMDAVRNAHTKKHLGSKRAFKPPERLKGKNNKAKDPTNFNLSLQWMQGSDAWRILNTRIHNAMLARWQILTAAARCRNYEGPTDNAEISKNPEKARRAWNAWIETAAVHLDWLRVQMIDLLNKRKFHDLREVVEMMSK
jgi:hypothetical protein